MILLGYLAGMLGSVSVFMDGPEQVVTMALCLLCGAAYLWTMGRRARRDAR